MDTLTEPLILHKITNMLPPSDNVHLLIAMNKCSNIDTIEDTLMKQKKNKKNRIIQQLKFYVKKHLLMNTLNDQWDNLLSICELTIIENKWFLDEIPKLKQELEDKLILFLWQHYNTEYKIRTQLERYIRLLSGIESRVDEDDAIRITSSLGKTSRLF